ncbi:radical SAM methylthiotransferase, MiaB/RimO family [Necator americanus]|uniref:Radical SAM methylthiotransferase, MiaB/RimO family n=1 Tax=Necator americanus TaxID=51031 RepID=W2SUD4_NECAM|nr:radical SAM methylthiotransferase, MiaB/RimO family [Necator americanus]ETN73133.1 radical SAM methylthiotransferase, MiaB/RimO family [Necator americanus]
MRVRFTSPHPKDFPIELIRLIKERPNICNQLHLPAQSGDDATLERMGRGYTRELYLKLVDDIRQIIPDVSLTSDFIAGFCGETEEAHQRTVELIRNVKYTFCYVFPYSMREKTRAHYRLVDDVPEDIKRRRLEELAAVFREGSLAIHQSLIGTEQLVLVEGNSKRSPTALQGRADNGTKVIFENTCGYEPGDYVVVRLIRLIKERPNICNQLHLPAQSGDDATLERMGRGYTRELYLKLVDDIRQIIPDVSLTSDFIAGFCGETEEAHQRTVELIRNVKYTFCYVFPYSMREKTRAHYRLVDDVPEDIKRRRHEELAAVFREGSLAIHQSLVGTEQLVLVEGNSKRSATAVQGRADNGTKVIFENTCGYEPGDYVVVRITGCTSQTMNGESIRKATLKEFYN